MQRHHSYGEKYLTRNQILAEMFMDILSNFSDYNNHETETDSDSPIIGNKKKKK